MITDSVIVKKYQNAIFTAEEIGFLNELREIAETIEESGGADADYVFHDIVDDITRYASPNVDFNLEDYYN